MVDAFAEGCSPAPASVTAPAGPGRYGTLRADLVQAGVYKAYAVDSRQLAVAGGRALAGRLARARRGEVVVPAIPVDARPVLDQLWDQVDQWGQPGADNPGHLRTLAEGGLMIVDGQGRSTSDRTEELVGDILVGESNYTFICRMRPPVPTVENPRQTPIDPPPPESDGRPDWVLVKTKDGLTELNLEDKEFAEFSFTDDQEAGDRTFGLAFTAGARFDESLLRLGGGSSISAALTPYVSYDRQGGDDPAADGYVNNLNLGLQAAGSIQFRGSRTWLGYYSLSYAHETDDDFDSDANSLELKLDPPLPVSWPYHRMFSRASGTAERPTVEARWTLEGVADWVDADPCGGTGLPWSTGRPLPSGGPFPRSGCGSSRSLSAITIFLSLAGGGFSTQGDAPLIVHYERTLHVERSAELLQHRPDSRPERLFPRNLGCASLCHQHKLRRRLDRVKACRSHGERCNHSRRSSSKP